jgi:phosphate transport system substrate-binding protein
MLHLVTHSRGAIGYTEQATAIQDRLQTASLRNRSGAYVAPTLRATTAVGDQPHAPGDLSFSTVDAPGAGAYPIASGIYMLTYRDPCEAGLVPREAQAAQQVLDFVLAGGQSLVRRLSFAPLPSGLRADARSAVRHLLCASQPIGSL